MAIINGTAGNDTRIGTAEADTINGFAGNDLITGDEGNDLVRMGAGNDTFFWHIGDGSDTLRGQAGFDTLVFECSAILEDVTISRNATRAILSHSFGATMDLLGVERIYVQALAGVDAITINNLAGTDVTQVLVDLASAPGIGSGGDGEVDTVGRSGGAGNDIFNVALVGENVSVTGPTAAVTIRNADAGDFLEVAGIGGNDTVNASKLPANIMRLTLDGGSGNDTITGSQGNDLLLGDAGNDVVAGSRGADFVDLGTGNDLFAWVMGDGDDTVQGGDGIDTLLIAASQGDNFIEISANGASSQVLAYANGNGRLVGEISADDVERIRVRTLTGSDFVNIRDLTGTDVSAVDVDFAASGTLPDAYVDGVNAFDTAADNVVDVTWSGSKVVVTGLPARVTIANAGVEDSLFIIAGGGNDVIDARDLPAGKISLGFSTSGNDTIFGSAGNDRVFGGAGNEVAHLGAGNDQLDGGGGNDVAHMGAGNDAMDGGDGNDVANLGAGNDRYTYNWTASSGNDTIDGGGGIDTFAYRDQNGGPNFSTFTIQADAGRVSFSRTAGEVISLNAVERMQVLVGGGSDIIDVNNLAGTGAKLVAIDLAAFVGSPVGDGASDSIRVDGTAGNDLVTIGKIAGGVTIAGLPAQVTVIHADNGGSVVDLLEISGGAGNDTFNASAMSGALHLQVGGDNGNDSILGGAGPDNLHGGLGRDTLIGGASFDRLFGDAGNDRLFGGAGSDLLQGGEGNDVLVGGRDNDSIDCGSGTDRVRYTSVLDGHDVISNFDGDPAGGQDVLDLDALFDSLGIAASKRAGLVRIDDIGDIVEVSVNADGKAGFELVVATIFTPDAIAKGQDVYVGT
jgi:Ca2+-binding RTX toxin-like protein